MNILFIPEYQGEISSSRTCLFTRFLEKKHRLIFLKPKEHWIKKRSFWPLRAAERFLITQSLIEEGKKKENIDLVFCRDYMYAFPGWFIAKHLKKPCVWDSEGSMKVFWDSSHKYPAQILPWMLLEKWLAKRFPFMIAMTEEDKKAYAEQGMDPDKIHIIPHCIPMEAISRKTREEARQSLQLPKEETFFLFFAMFDYLPNKAALHFLNEKVAPHLPGKLLLCGKGKLPKKLHPKIQYLGFLSFEKLYDLIRACDISLSPVWEANGTLTKALEMLAHGAPAVLTDVVRRGIPEIQDGVHALIAKDRDDFLQKTLRLAQDHSLQEKFGKNGPEIIRKKYDAGLHENELLRLVETLGK